MPEHGVATRCALLVTLVLAACEGAPAGRGNPGEDAAMAVDAGAMPTHRLGVGAAIAPEAGDPGLRLPAVTIATHVWAGPEGWAILDGPAGRVALIEPDGAVETVFGRRGEGPGELAAPARVARSAAGVAVLDLAATRLDRFDRTGRPRPRVSLPRAGCAGTMAEGLAPHEDAWIVLQRCADRAVTASRTLRVDRDGSVTELDRTAIAGQLSDPFLDPLLMAIPGEGVYVGTTRASCYRRVAGPGSAEHCLREVQPLPVPAEARARMEARLSERARSVGLALTVPDHLPLALDVRSVDGARRAVRRPVDTRSAPWVIEHDDGSSLTLVADGTYRVEPGPAGVLLLLDELEGMRAWVLPLPGGDR